MLHYDAMACILTECERARSLYPAFRSPHEGLSILQEEVEELKGLVYLNPHGVDPQELRENLKIEAVHVGAMALRFLTDLC